MSEQSILNAAISANDPITDGFNAQVHTPVFLNGALIGYQADIAKAPVRTVSSELEWVARELERGDQNDILYRAALNEYHSQPDFPNGERPSLLVISDV